MLTQKQKELLELLEDSVKHGDVMPSFEEMKDALGLQSKSGIHRLITGLEERGYIRRLPNRARALEVLRSAKKKTISALQNSIVSLPLYGKIAAGTPIEAIHDSGEQIDIPASMVRGGTHYGLTVSGDSMIEEGIFDGDLAIIRETKLAENGKIVVAFIPERNEATLKTFYKDGRNIRLEPANKAYKPQIYPANQIEVQGQLVGLYRFY